MPDLDINRCRLLNISRAHSLIDAAIDLLIEADKVMAEERKAGLPVPEIMAKTRQEAAKSRELLWNFLKRMP